MTSVAQLVILSFIFVICCSYVNTDSTNKSKNGKERILRRKVYNRKRFGRITLNKPTTDDIIYRENISEVPVTYDAEKRKKQGLPPVLSKSVVDPDYLKNKCWMNVNAKNHFDTMDELDDRFESVRKKYEEALESDDFDKQMLDMMLKTKGAAERVSKGSVDPGLIPAGINLGGYSMMRQPNSILFFHRMKLRNNTHFRVDALHNDLSKMVLTAKLSLNDLHILGAYERVVTNSNPSRLYYQPTFGEVEFLLRNVQYNMEGRYRLLRNKLTIELVVSNINTSDILMTYQNNEQSTTKPLTLERKNIDEFLDRLKTDLDKWLKDYFNDYLMYFGLEGSKANAKLLEYEKEKNLALNDYTDQVLEKIKKRLTELNFRAVEIPKFSVIAISGMQIKLTNGVLRGLDTIHRRGVATCKTEDNLRRIDMTIGFSSLQATYHYEAIFNTGVPPLNGVLFVTAHELIAHMGLVLTKNPETLNIVVDSIEQVKPESITVEGPANRIIGNFKNLLDRHVFTFISNAIVHNVKMISTITDCEPNLYAYNNEEQTISQENKSMTDISNKNVLNHESELKQTNDSESDEILKGDRNYTSNIEITIDNNGGEAPPDSSNEEIEGENRSNVKTEEVERIKGHIVVIDSDDDNPTKSDNSASEGTSETKKENESKNRVLTKSKLKRNDNRSVFINKIPGNKDE